MQRHATVPKTTTYSAAICECGKGHLHQQALWRHDIMKYYVPMRATQDSCRVLLTWSRCVTSSLPKADFRTRVTWTSSVFQMKQGTADRVTKIPTEFRRLNAVPIRDLRSDEGKYTAVANCIVTRGRFLSRCGQP